MQKYKNYRNKLTKIIRASEKNYYQQKLLAVKDNMFKTWKLLNTMMYRNTKFNKLNEIIIDGKLENDMSKIVSK